jgi:hypothetical protein
VESGDPVAILADGIVSDLAAGRSLRIAAASTDQ